MATMSEQLSSVIIFVVFGVMALAIVVAAVLSVYERVLPYVERWLGGQSLHGALADRLAAVRRRRRQEADEGDDDLDDDVAALLSMIPSATLVVDEHDEVVRANPQAYRLGVVSDDAISEASVLEAVRQVRASGGRQVFDIETSTPRRFIEVGDGEHGPDGTDVSGVSRPNWLKVTVGRISGRFVVVLLDDVSDAIRFSQVRDSFIINVSEQLLKPTDALERLSADLESGGLDGRSLAARAHEVRQASAHLNHLVGDLLLLIKAQAPVTPSSANRLTVLDQLQAVADQLKDMSAEMGVGVRVSGDATLTVNGEADQIRTAVTKLVENALAYSPAGSQVSVSVKRSEDGGHAVIRVIDQGTGIPKADQERIFERFWRGGNQNERSADGVGLGLAIVKHVALTHHGTAGVWSAPGQGSTFSLTLPLSKSVG